MTASGDRTARPNVRYVGNVHLKRKILIAIGLLCFGYFVIVVNLFGAIYYLYAMFDGPAPTMVNFIFNGTAPTAVGEDITLVIMSLLSVYIVVLLIKLWTGYLEIDDEHIEWHGVFRTRFSVSWSEISRITLEFPKHHARHDMENGLNVYCGDRKVFTFPHDWNMPLFAYLVQDHLPHEIWKSADAVVRGNAFSYEEENGIAHKIMV